MRNAAAVILFAFGCLIGLKLADFDRNLQWWLPQIVHRSLLTHGFIAPLLLFLAVQRRQEGRGDQARLSVQGPPLSVQGPRLFVLGLCLATAVYLCFDLFPMCFDLSEVNRHSHDPRHSYDPIFVPLTGRITPLLSMVWLVTGAQVSLYLACRLLRGLPDLRLALLGLVVCFGVSAAAAAAAEPILSLFALATLEPLALAAFLLPRPRHEPDGPADDILKGIRF